MKEMREPNETRRKKPDPEVIKITHNSTTREILPVLKINKAEDNIRIHHECEGGIEKFVPRITDWHHEACRVMTIGDREGVVFLSHPHTNNGLFSCSPLLYLIYIGKTWKRLPENPECDMVTSF